MLTLEKDGPVFVLRMNSGENRFNRAFIDEINAHLDEVEKSPLPSALVTVGEGKYYSNGLDLNWLMGGGGVDMKAFVDEVHLLFGRVLFFPRPTIAAINGHAFAGGAMLAIAHDFRVMRSDRGYFCVPEIDLKLPPTPGMNALLATKMDKQVLHESLVTGKRYAAGEAAAKRIVDEALPEAEVLPRAIALAKELAAKDKGTLTIIKRQLYRDALVTLGNIKQ